MHRDGVGSTPETGYLLALLLRVFSRVVGIKASPESLCESPRTNMEVYLSLN